MKDFLLSLFTVPVLLILIYILGLISYGYKKKLKYYSLCLLMMFVLSLPIFGKIFSLPLLIIPKVIKTHDLNEAKLAVVLTGGIYKNLMGNYQPSKNTEERVMRAKKLLINYNIPLMISGGVTKLNAPSEAELTKSYYNLTYAMVETESINTYQSAVNLKKYCSRFNNNLIIITDALHALRSFLSFKSQGCNPILLNYNYNFHWKDMIPSIYGFTLFNKAVYEYFANFYYIFSLKINLFNLI